MSEKLDTWLNIATDKLSDHAKVRIHRETTAHVTSLMEKNGGDEAAAILMLGSPKKASKRFRWKYLTEKESASLIQALKPTGALIAARWYYPVACLALIGIGYWEDGIVPELWMFAWGVLCGVFAVANTLWLERCAKRVADKSLILDDQICKRIVERAVVFGGIFYTLSSVGLFMGVTGTLNSKLSLWALLLMFAMVVVLTPFEILKMRKALRNIEDMRGVIYTLWNNEAH